MNLPRFLRRRTPTTSDAARTLGRLGGKARAQKLREPIRARTRQICRELNMPIPPALDQVP